MEGGKKQTDLWLCKPQHQYYRNPRHCGRCISVMLGAWTQVLDQKGRLTAESNRIKSAFLFFTCSQHPLLISSPSQSRYCMRYEILKREEEKREGELTLVDSLLLYSATTSLQAPDTQSFKNSSLVFPANSYFTKISFQLPKSRDFPLNVEYPDLHFCEGQKEGGN